MKSTLVTSALGKAPIRKKKRKRGGAKATLSDSRARTVGTAASRRGPECACKMRHDQERMAAKPSGAADARDVLSALLYRVWDALQGDMEGRRRSGYPAQPQLHVRRRWSLRHKDLYKS
jgi:hypothetical protein